MTSREIGVAAILSRHDGGILMKCNTKGEVKNSEEAKARHKKTELIFDI